MRESTTPHAAAFAVSGALHQETERLTDMNFRLRHGPITGLFAVIALALPAIAIPSLAQEPAAIPAELEEITVTAPAEETLSPAAAESPLARTATPAMWRVTDEDSDFILLGTIHVLPPEMNWRDDALTAAFENADVIYFEMDPDNLDEVTKAVSIIQTEGKNPDGVNLSAMLGSADSQKLQEISSALGINFVDLEKLRPWNTFLALGNQLNISKGYKPGAGVDRMLVDDARVAGKELRFFETMSEQIGFFSNLDPKSERDALVFMIRNWEEEVESLDALIQAWAIGDTDYIDTSMNEDIRDVVPAVYQALIVKRNAAWAEDLDTALKNESGKGFVAVGAAHLVGDELSVPALLAAKGYTVTRYGIDGETVPEAANDNELRE